MKGIPENSLKSGFSINQFKRKNTTWFVGTQLIIKDKMILFQYLNPVISIINMNKRSKSSVNLNVLAQKLANKTLQYDHLQDKVDRSRPILQTIYKKVKLKESLYEKKIQQTRRQLTQNKQLAHEYKKLFEDGLKIIEKSKMFDKSKYEGNYLRNKEKQTQSKSIYEQYRERIDKGKGEENQGNPEVKKLQEKTKELSQEMKNEIDKLRIIRSRSQKNMLKSKSTVILRKLPVDEMNKPKQKQSQKYKNIFAQKQREKLSRI